jgi:Leucine-rich repeat (LRR) protein
LAVLNLSWNDLTGFFELSQLPASLEYVSFIANQFQTSLQENRGVNCLERLCNIGRLVNLKSLRLTDKEETDFSEHDTLQNTQVLGTMPTEIGELTNLELLTLEDLRLAGSLPTELGQLTQLTHLALSHNELTGFVPTQLSYLTNLQELALESNENLKGTLEGLCGAERNQSNNMNGTTVDFSSDCLLTSIACTCCRTCCHPNGDCQDMMLNDAEEWQQQQQQVP